jgi:HAD superfamily hydrolase (TIGR01509 family)
MLAAAGLEPDLLVSADEVRRPKPAPDVILGACEQLGVALEGCLLIGDSEFDRQAAKAAGVFFVGFKMEGDARIETLGDLPRFFEDFHAAF